MNNNDFATRQHRMQCEKCDHKFIDFGLVSCPKCGHDYVINYTLGGKPTTEQVPTKEQIKDKKQTN